MLLGGSEVGGIITDQTSQHGIRRELKKKHIFKLTHIKTFDGYVDQD